MKYNKIIYITILIISALIAYTSGFESFTKKNESRTNALTTPDNSALTSETLIERPAVAQPDYSFNLRAAGISAQMPAYCIYNLSIYGDIAKISKIHECILGFKVSKILHINTTKNTLLLNETGTKLYCFNESNNKIESRIISFSPAANNNTSSPASAATASDFTNGVKINYTTHAATHEDIITALAKTKDEKLIAAALKKSGTIQIILAHNFEHILSIADKSTDLNSIKSLDFDTKNNLYITTSDKSLNSTTLYLCRANLSYSKLEKINWFSLAADSSLFDPINDIFIYYNRNSGTVFKIDCRNAQSGILMNNPPQLSELPPSDALKPSASQLVKLSGSCALVRNDTKLIKIFNPTTGQITQEVKLNSATGLEITGGGDEKYAAITSADDGTISLINRSNPKLINAGRLEGLNIITCIENE